MSTVTKLLGLIVILGLVAAPVYGAMETAAEAPGKTLADFQRAYAGTKPVIAWHKFQEYQMLQKAPRTTLEPSHMRAESKPGVSDENYDRGTKPVINFLRRR